jgi:integrating conjugative element protein (TIGR03758 family)
MSMTPAQSSAFRAAGGYAQQDSSTLMVGLALTFTLLFTAWAIGSGFRGWTRGQLSQHQFGALVLKVIRPFA